DTYVIGSLCTAVGTCPESGGSTSAGSAGLAGGGSGGSAGLGGSGPLPPGTLTADLNGSGPERLPLELMGVEPTHFLVAADATSTTWEARVGQGFDVVAPAALELGEPSPFTDPGSVLRHAGTATFSAESTWADTSAGALALEVVFRGEPEAALLSQRDVDAGLELFLDQEGRLNLRLDAGADEIVASSQALVADAWHHCLALFDAEEAVAQIFCNGQAGEPTSVPAGFAVNPVAVAATLGGENAARLHWAELASWQTSSWGPRGAWTDLARERFARLVGTYAEGSREPLPFADVRPSGAYVDMTPSDAPELRRLHPVGEHWPRIVCRPTLDTARACGLLVETSSSQQVAPGAFTLDNWDALELTVAAAAAPGPTGADTLYAVIPSATTAEHALEFSAPFGEGPVVLSLFARAGSARLVRAEVVGAASATFDLAALAVTESTGTLVASAEDWGDGLVRLSYSFDIDAGSGLLRLAVLADDGAAAFAGDGSVAAELGDVELRFRSYSTPLPTFGAIQQADHLVYPAGNGNLPGGPWFSFSAQIWLPAAPLVADAAVFNANFATHYDQQINLFVSPDGSLQFWGLQGDATHWQFSNPALVTDGNVHQVVASVGPEGATLSVDGESVTEPAGAYDLTVLDRVEIGTSTSSSGPLTGMIGRIRIESISD
ncbi:MAG TPA: LamG-like jellyroll fold domain-containing protein, partial [Polyangiaceae bacterium]|nr:LamG-like jellyroll fold domain-containing protein [Polyangiaceae bacterium]